MSCFNCNFQKYFLLLILFSIGLFCTVILFYSFKPLNLVHKDSADLEKQKNIFFIETQSLNGGISRLDPRQACAIESASLLNPDWKIVVFVLNADSLENSYWDVVESLPNVEIRFINAVEFTEETPTQNLMKNGLKTRPEWIVSHTSDVLRYTVLYKYAGVYMDLDSISLKSMDTLVPNFAGQEGPPKYTKYIMAGSGVLGLSDDKIGRQIAKELVEDVGANYNGSDWAANGPGKLTDAIKKLCGTNLLDEATQDQCSGFKLYPLETFYAIKDYTWFFDPEYFEQGMELIEGAVVTHLWNSLSKDSSAAKGNETVICEIGKRYCPSSFEIGDEWCL